ncbi:MAG: hypothetical protein Kow0049_11890 [Stanieria sp.]
MNTKNPKFEVVIVGAGAAGIGCGVVLKDLGIKNFVILERHQVGASFSFWPQSVIWREAKATIKQFLFNAIPINYYCYRLPLKLVRSHFNFSQYY